MLKNQAAELDTKYRDITYRHLFHIPPFKKGEVIYLCGNSLGLQPKETAYDMQRELDKWAKQAVEGHFSRHNPWVNYHKQFTKYSAELVGALESEVVVMNTLTVNLHLMMVSFYRPTKHKFKIIIEAGVFPSDQYAVESQVNFHSNRGNEILFNNKEAIIEIKPRNGEELIRTEDILEQINQHKNELALVMLSGVNYYTGQLYDIEKITEVTHVAGAIAGFDLAHAAGNIPLNLHNWNVDFAVWCNYKYINGGPGTLASAFVHEKHFNNKKLPRFAGWWGHNEHRRFKMEKEFEPIHGAEGWQLSNAPILSMVPLKSSLQIFHNANIKKLRKKSIELTAYLENLIYKINKDKGKEIIKIITPKDSEARGCQLSLVIHGYGKRLFDAISSDGVICDWREPSVIRIAPVPLYNTFKDVYDFYKILKKHL